MENQEEFTRLWTAAQPKVAGFIAAVVPDYHLAEDLLQEVAVICLSKFKVYDRQRSFIGWALGIARLEVLAQQRRWARKESFVLHSELLEELEWVCEELAPELEARTRALRECMQSLSGRIAKVLKLRYEGSFRFREIARHLNLSEVNARVLLSRARSLLRSCIQRKLDSYASS